MPITFVPGRVVCPFAGIGARAANASNRIVVDDATSVTIDRHRIVVRDDRDCPAKTVIADVVWLARAGAARFTIHAELFKTGRTWEVDLHTHEPPNMRREDIEYEPFELVGNERVLVDRAALAKAVAKQPLGRRLAAKLTAQRDHLAGATQDPSKAGYRVLDRSIGIGAFGAGSFLVRAKLTSLAATNEPLIARGSLVEMLRDGAWELSLEALTDRWLPELVQRDMTLFGLGDVPVLQSVRAGKLRKGQTLAFRCIPGANEIRFDDAVAPFPDALEVARAYLEFHMIGGMMAAAVQRGA